MLSGEVNENDEKTTIGLISKNTSLHVQHTFFCTFLCRCFARLLRETSRNFLVTRFVEGMSCSFSLFFHCRSFSPWWTWDREHPAATKFHIVPPTENVSFAPFLVELRWPVALLSLFLCLSLSLYSKFVDMTINLSLIL